MKRIIICVICNKPKKFSDSYAVKVANYRLERILEPDYDKYVKARMCRTCTKRLGYKVKKLI